MPSATTWREQTTKGVTVRASVSVAMGPGTQVKYGVCVEGF